MIYHTAREAVRDAVAFELAEARRSQDEEPSADALACRLGVSEAEIVRALETLKRASCRQPA